jgi:hypothetical protein
MAVIDVATRRMIEMFDQFVYRDHNTNDTRTCKCHSHLHSTHTYEEYGDPRQYNAGKGERGLKDWAKFLAKTAQKRDEATSLQQTTSRIKDVCFWILPIVFLVTCFVILDVESLFLKICQPES